MDNIEVLNFNNEEQPKVEFSVLENYGEDLTRRTCISYSKK